MRIAIFHMLHVQYLVTKIDVQPVQGGFFLLCNQSQSKCSLMSFSPKQLKL